MQKLWKDAAESPDADGMPGKRTPEYDGINYYWYIKKDSDHILRIHIVSEDKALQLTFGFDSEIGIGTQNIKKLLEKYLEEK